MQHPESISLKDLLLAVRQELYRTFDRGYWVRAEISEIKKLFELFLKAESLVYTSAGQRPVYLIAIVITPRKGKIRKTIDSALSGLTVE